MSRPLLPARWLTTAVALCLAIPAPPLLHAQPNKGWQQQQADQMRMQREADARRNAERDAQGRRQTDEAARRYADKQIQQAQEKQRARESRDALREQMRSEQKKNMQGRMDAMKEGARDRMKKGPAATTAGHAPATGAAGSNRGPTTGEVMQKGRFTGKMTPNGKALYSYRGRLVAIPSKRVSGQAARMQREPRAAAVSQEAMQARIRGLAAANENTRAPVAAVGGCPPPGKPGYLTCKFNEAAAKKPGTPSTAIGPRVRPMQRIAEARQHGERMDLAKREKPPPAVDKDQLNHLVPFYLRPHYDAAIKKARESKEPALVLGRFPRYVAVGFVAKANWFNDPLYEEKKAVFIKDKEDKKESWTEEELRRYMFEKSVPGAPSNKEVIKRHFDNGGRFFLASPYDKMKGTASVSHLELDYMENELGMKLSEDGLEMVRS